MVDVPKLLQVFGRLHRNDFTLVESAIADCEDFLDWAEFNSILNYSQAQFPLLRLVKSGERLAPELYTLENPSNRGFSTTTVDSTKLTQLLREGATLVLSAIDELSPTLESVALALERETRCRVSVNAYLTAGNTAGFDTHWDDHDAFIIQVRGSKTWRVYGTTRKHPLFRDTDNPIPPPEGDFQEIDFRQGSAMFIPRGWWHSASPTSDISLHLVFGFMAPTGIDLLRWIVDQARSSESLRAPIPAGERDQRVAYVDHVKGEFTSFFTERVIDDFLDHRDVHQRLRDGFSFPYSLRFELPESYKVRMASGRALVDTNDPNTVILLLDSKRIVLPKELSGILQILKDGCWHNDKEVSAGLHAHANWMSSFMRQMLELGLVVVEPKNSADDD